MPRLLDIGDCHTGKGDVVNCTNGNGRVPYLSPSLLKSTGPQDLFEYWLKTTPSDAAAIRNDEL